MKICFTFTILVAACGMLSAQPVLNSCAQSFQAGDAFTATIRDCDATGFTPVQMGANVTWNYANLISTHTGAYTATLVPVGSTPNPSPFTNATIAEDLGGGYHTYFSYQGGAATYHGYYLDPYICLTYSDPIVQYTCPLNYGGTFADTYAGEDCYANQFTGTRKGTYAGYGTLILPHATFSNAVLIHIYDTLVDGPVDTYYEFYIWYDGTTNLKHLSAARTSNNFSPNVMYAVTYMELTSSTVSAEQAALADAIQVYPNPARDEVRVDVPAEVGRGQFQLMDLHGKTLLQNPIHIGQGQVQLPELPAGIYLYQVRDQRGNLAKAGKLVKE